MSKFRGAIVVAVLFVTFVSTVDPLFAARKRVQEIDVKRETAAVRIRNNIGNIVVVGGLHEKPKIKIQKLKFDDKKCLVSHQYRSELNQLTITVDKMSSFGPQKCQVKITAYIPSTADLYVANGVGSLSVDGMSSSVVEYNIGSGNVRIKGSNSQKLIAKIGSGKLDVLRSNIATAEVSSGAGNIKLESNTRDLKVDVGSGNVEVHSKKTAKDLSYTIHLGTGSVNIALPFDAKFQSQLLTSRGRAKNLFTDDPKSSSSLQVHTGIGDIVVRKLQ